MTDKKSRKIELAIFACFIIIMLVVFSKWNEADYLKCRNYHFDGIVDSVSYNIKDEAAIIIKGSHFTLGAPFWNFDHNRIQKGDSIRKERNSMIIKLIKPGGKVILQDGE